MPKYTYPGDLDAINAAIAGKPNVSIGAIRALKPFATLTSLISQAGYGEPAAAPGIIAAAEAHVAVLEAAAAAAKTIIAEAKKAFAPATVPVPDPDVAPVVTPTKTAKGS